MTRYIAVKMGFRNGTRVRPGEEFEAEDGIIKDVTKNGRKLKRPDWFVKKEDFKPIVAKKGQSPTTFSEIARQTINAPIDLKNRNKNKPEVNDPLDVI